MAELVALLTVPTGIDGIAPRIGALGDRAPTSIVRPTLPGGRNAGDLLVRWGGASVVRELDFGLGAAVTLIDGALFETVAGEGDPCASAIHRTALFHAFRNPTPDRLARFEAETAAMPRRMPFVRGWRLGRVTRSWGRFAWSYVWEQGYDRLEDLTERYMHHPCHWGQVDRWFDPEHPDWLIDPGLCHAFCRTREDVA